MLISPFASSVKWRKTRENFNEFCKKTVFASSLRM